MTFNSYEYILLFLPITWAIYRLTRRFGLSNEVLLSASVIFYGFAGMKFLAWLVAAVVVNWLLARWMSSSKGRKRKCILGLVCGIDVAVLILTKYDAFLVENFNALLHLDIRLMQIMVPLGISFFTFSLIAYAVGVYRAELGKVRFVDYALYVFYFPKLLMGPITEPKDFLEAVRSGCQSDWKDLASGLQLFLLGLCKKSVLADAFARAVAYGFGTEDLLSTVDVMVLALSYTFEIYFDFSGYTDMAIGVSRMFGIELPNNFDSPYLAVSVRDFWRRWHLTLTKFLTKYVYFPLGGSRCGTLRTYLNILLVFLVSGIWHGANWTFIVWGLLHGLLMVRDRVMEAVDEKIPRVIRWAVMFAVTNFLWLLFRSNDLEQFRRMVSSVKALRFSVDTALIQSGSDPLSLWIMLVIGMIICFGFKNNSRCEFHPTISNFLFTVAAGVLALCFLGGSNTFVYFNF